MEESKPFLEMRKIVKHFPGVLALSGVDFDVRPGEVHVLLGENGAGKSTLIKVLSGVYPPDSGEILLDGKPVSIRNPHDAQMLGIGTVYQEFNLVPDMSVAENIFLGREPMVSKRLGIVDRRKLVEQTRELLPSLDLQVAPETTVRQLGVAQQQMVEIAKALSLKSRVIVLDEPTAALTAHEIDRLFKTIQELKRRGVAMIYISHRLDEVKIVGDRATVLRDGTWVGTVSVATTPIDQLIRMMVGRELKDKFPKVTVEPGEEVLRVENLTRKGVLHDISFHLRRGEILGIAGLVGSKRTEMARAIFGADPLDGGRIILRGKHAAIKSPAQAIRQRLALLPEDRKRHGVLATLSVKENITLSILQRFYPGRLSQPWAGEKTCPGICLFPADRDPESRPLGDVSQRRQPAEGRHRQVVEHPGRHLSLRRADTGHRRGREGRGLSIDGRPREAGGGNSDDLLGAA